MSESIEELWRRVLAAEQEVRSIRAALTIVSRCRCPVGFGSKPNPDCPKHGNRT